MVGTRRKRRARALLAPALVAAVVIGPAAPAAAATDETTEARALPSPALRLPAPTVRDGRVSVCLRVSWRSVRGRLGSRSPSRVDSFGLIRVAAFGARRRGAGRAHLQTVGRRVAVRAAGGPRRYCLDLSRRASRRLLGGSVRHPSRAALRRARSRLYVNARQHLDIDRDGAAEHVGLKQRGAEALGGTVPCDMTGMSAVTALTSCRNWITYASPNLNDNAPLATIERELRFLHEQGMRGIVTYTIAGNMSRLPEIAKRIGYQKVLAGLWDPAAEIGTVKAIEDKIDGVVVGNEGVRRDDEPYSESGRYTITELERWVGSLKASHPDLAIAHTNQWFKYLRPQQGEYGRRLMELGDIIFPTLHAFWDNNPVQNGLFSANPLLGAWFTQHQVSEWFLDPSKNTRSLPVVLKESWWPSALTSSRTCPLQPNNPPTAGPQWPDHGVWKEAPYTEKAQAAFFKDLVRHDVRFVYGEPFDVPAKTECKQPPPAGYGGVVGPHWGIWNAPGSPKQAAGAVDVGHY